MASSRLTIVVVDDDPIVLEQVRSALEGAGYRVITRNRAIGCVALTLQDQPDLLLLDVSMPGVEGDTLVKLLKVASPTRRTVVLLHSGLRETELQARVRSSGADGYICKTKDPRALVRKVNEWLAGRVNQPVAVNPVSDVPASQPNAGNRPHILFVDDDMMMLSSYRRLIQRERMDAEFALSGAQALKWILSAEPPDVVVCDLMMPEPGGEEVFARAVQSDRAWKERFVFVTGFKDADRELRRSFHGSVLLKPVAPAELLVAVRRCLLNVEVTRQAPPSAGVRARQSG